MAQPPIALKLLGVLRPNEAENLRSFVRLTTEHGFCYEGYTSPADVNLLVGTVSMHRVRLCRPDGQQHPLSGRNFDCLHLRLSEIANVKDRTKAGSSAKSLYILDSAIVIWYDLYRKL